MGQYPIMAWVKEMKDNMLLEKVTFINVTQFYTLAILIFDIKTILNSGL